MSAPAPVGPVLLLASASPRRRELLERLGVAFEVRAADVDEAPAPGEAAGDLVRRLAAAKAGAVLDAAAEPEVVVLAADTVVVVDGTILGKPVDDADAARMLAALSGRTHQVVSGVAVARRSAPGSGSDREVELGPAVSLHVEVVETDVTFVELSDRDVAWYVATGEPADKAGAYAIQGRGAVFVAGVAGSPDNVIGLPLAATRRLLAAVGLDPLSGATRPS